MAGGPSTNPRRCVTEVGSEVIGLGPGDRVAGILHLLGLKPSVGTHADETVLPAAAVARVPDGLDLVEAASLPLNALAARQALDLLGPAEGRTLLVTVAAERGIAVRTVNVEPDSQAIAGLLGLAAEGTLEVRVAGRVPVREAAKAYDKVAGGGQRGRWLLIP